LRPYIFCYPDNKSVSAKISGSCCFESELYFPLTIGYSLWNAITFTTGNSDYFGNSKYLRSI
jgi:hypothetical protein